MRWLPDLRSHAGTLAERFAARQVAPRIFGESPFPEQALFPVLLRKTAGVAFPCTFVYSAFELGSDINLDPPLAMNLSPYFGGVRSAFVMNPAADGAYGLASYIGGVLVLWFAPETINATRTC